MYQHYNARELWHSGCTRAKQTQHHKKGVLSTWVVLRKGVTYSEKILKTVLLLYSLHLAAIITVVLPPWLTQSKIHAGDSNRTSGANAWLAQTLRGGNPAHYLLRHSAAITLDELSYFPSVFGTLSHNTSRNPMSFVGAHIYTEVRSPTSQRDPRYGSILAAPSKARANVTAELIPKLYHYLCTTSVTRNTRSEE